MRYHKSFTILHTIIAMSMLIFGIFSLNIFLLDLSSYLIDLQTKHKVFNMHRNLTACLNAGGDRNVCLDLFYDASK